MTTKFRVTYEVVTPESAEQGELASQGYVLPRGWKFALPDALDCDVSEYDITLREALDITGENLTDVGQWFATEGEELDYLDGSSTTYALHPPDTITESSYQRLKRYLESKH